jgi:spermidine/putrescine transport system substrate-binding protein
MSENLSLWKRSYDRKGFVAVGAMAAVAAACGGKTSEDEPSGAGTTTGGTGPKQVSGTLFYYNWADYVNPKTYTEFTKQTGVKVKRDFYVGNEDLQAKLNAGARGYDLIVPTGNPFVTILADDNLLTELDWSQLPNVRANIDPKFQGLPYDRDDTWSVPKDWGTTGFSYRTDLIRERPTAWREFFDLAKGPYSKKATVLDSTLEVIGAAALMLGFSYNTDDEGELEQVKDELIALKPHLLAITSTEYRQLLISGRAVISLGWNGDGQAVAAKKPARYVIPDEGAEFWVDAYAIPVGAKNPEAAHAWIDFTYRPRINALETSYTYYGSPLKRRLLEGVLDDAVLNDPTVFPSQKKLAKLTVANPSPEGSRLRDRIWTEFKAA